MNLDITIKCSTLFMVIALLSALLSACGGGGGGGSANVGNSGTISYTVGGTTAGLTGAVVLQDNSGDNLTISANDAFTFATPVTTGSNYNVSILTQPYGQTCSLSNGTGTVSGSNITNIALVCSINAYTMGGTVSGLTGTLVLQDNNSDSLTITANGTFNFASKVASGSSYSVTVLNHPVGQGCSVVNSTGTIAQANVSNVIITCVTNTYSIGGTITGLSGSVILQDSSSDNITLSTNGSFYFPTTVAYGGAYNATVLTQPSGQTCTVTGGSGTATSNVTSVVIACATISTLTLSLPSSSIGPNNLAVIVASGDPNSVAIANYYQTKRSIPASNIITVNLTTGTDTISDTDFATLKAAIDAQLPSGVQATLLTWTAPSRVVGTAAGSCVMSITSAMAFGFNSSYCANSCTTTTASSYFDSESAQPWQDFQMRPSMMLGASSVSAAQTLIDLGVSADATYPPGDGYLLRTTDANRNVRYTDYLNLPTLWTGNSGIQLFYIDNYGGASSGDSITGKSNVLFYFTGLASVPNIITNTYQPGAIADSLTSFGGYLPSGNGQMPITNWLNAGVTASYGTVAEPCNYTQKFSQASVLIDHYYRGATLIEAYWKAVSEPGQGLFIGEPLAQPFRDSPSFTISGGQYVISTRALRSNSSYTLAYRTAASSTWTTLASFTTTQRAQPKVLYAPLPPANATQIHWVGPCSANSSQQCILSTSN